MPYIKDQQNRKMLNAAAGTVWTMIVRIGSLRGNLNFVIFKLFKYYISEKGQSYTNIADFLSELHECECEIRRRFLEPYEDKKIAENGDVE